MDIKLINDDNNKCFKQLFRDSYRRE